MHVQLSKEDLNFETSLIYIPTLCMLAAEGSGVTV